MKFGLFVAAFAVAANAISLEGDPIPADIKAKLDGNTAELIKLWGGGKAAMKKAEPHVVEDKACKPG